MPEDVPAPDLLAITTEIVAAHAANKLVTQAALQTLTRRLPMPAEHA